MKKNSSHKTLSIVKRISITNIEGLYFQYSKFD